MPSDALKLSDWNAPATTTSGFTDRSEDEGSPPSSPKQPLNGAEAISITINRAEYGRVRMTSNRSTRCSSARSRDYPSSNSTLFEYWLRKSQAIWEASIPVGFPVRIARKNGLSVPS